jgi:hypothetical protein
MSFSASSWRAPVTGAVTGMVVAAAVVGSSALASGGGAPASRTAAKVARASIDCGAPAASAGVKGPSDGPGDAPFLAAVAQMEQAGTIDQAQARVLDADIQKGRVDPDQLVANGTLSQAQADTVMERLGAVKRSLAPGAQQTANVKAAERKRSHR